MPHRPPGRPEAPGSLQARFEAAEPFESFLPTVERNAPLWHGVWERAVVPDEAVRRVEDLPGTWHLLVLSADWCGDAVNTLPILARLAERAGNLDMRLLERDDNLDLMDLHLTNGRARSIPVVMALDGDFVERAWWGPRPTELQSWVTETGLQMPPDARYREVRRWYARDRGQTTLDEVIGMLERAANA